ncbi:MAG: Spy/CpxP family protein refolding chaperone [Gemmatimonadaceae bacterium]|nr:Spy/CpxP family protein refolding chaperone [Gemmatimonadaceae bacterium]
MKASRIVALGALLVCAAAVAGAQSPALELQGGPRGPGRRAAMPPGIELTDAQKASASEIEQKYQPEMRSLRESMQGGGDRTEIMGKARALREKMQGDIRAILTPEQQSVFDKYVAEMKVRMDQMQRQAPSGR